jgi:hypothetical protein
MSYSVENIKIDKTYRGEVISATISGTPTIDLSQGNNHVLNLSGNVTAFDYSNAEKSTYNFIVNAGTFSFDLATSSNFKTPNGDNLGLTGSFIMSGIYDGSDMFIAVSENYISL